MQDTLKSTIALIRYAPGSDLNFAHIVGEMEKSLTLSAGHSYELTWDHDDVTIFDFQSTRIVLAVADSSSQPAEMADTPNCMLVSVGSPPEKTGNTQPYMPHEKLCQKIVERVCDYYTVDNVSWLEVGQSVDTDLIDQLMEDFIAPERQRKINEVIHSLAEGESADAPASDISSEMRDITNASEMLDRLLAKKSGSVKPFVLSADQMLRTSTPTWVEAEAGMEATSALLSEVPSFPVPLRPTRPSRAIVANDTPDLPMLDQDRLEKIREALYFEDPEAEQKPSIEIRLSASALDVTLMMVCLPVGAAMLTYHTLRGGEIRHTAQMLTLTGLFLTIAETPIAQQIMAMV